MTDVQKEHFAEMLAAFEAEHREAKKRFSDARASLTIGERVTKGLALDRMVLDDFEASADRVRVHLVREKVLPESTYVRLRRGTPLVVWSPDSEERCGAIMLKLRRKDGAVRIEVAMNQIPDWIYEVNTLVVEEDAPQTTFDRGREAIASMVALIDNPKLRDNLSKDNALSWIALLHDSTPLSELHTHPVAELNPAQQQAVGQALSQQLSLIHGPPGTGKTHTLVSMIKEAVTSGEKILVVAPSNTAVDNLAERLIDADVATVRVGHPARISSKLQSHTLDHLVRDSEAHKLSRKFHREAQAIRKKTKQKSLQGYQGRSERRALFREAKNLTRDARRQLDVAAQSALRAASVVCVTCASATGRLFEDLTFNRLVIDEATQSTDPMTWVAISTALSDTLASINFAGDPKQLPPTVLVEGTAFDLTKTMFERLHHQAPSRVTLLDTQYRMTEEIMTFPSQNMYEGKLKAHASNRTRSLRGFCKEDALRSTPWCFLDTAGKGFAEEKHDDDPSTCNPGNAGRVRDEVQRLLRRGLTTQHIAVITPYDAQARLLRSVLESECADGLEVSSIDGFQGREAEVIVIDLVRSNEDGHIGFLADTRRMNVALTRARRFMLVVGDSATLGQHRFYSDFLDAAEAAGNLRSAWEDEPTDEAGIT